MQKKDIIFFQKPIKKKNKISKKGNSHQNVVRNRIKKNNQPPKSL